MGKDGLGRKLAIVAAATGAVLLVLRVVGGRDGGSLDEETNDNDEIDRVDTGRSDEDRGGSPVDTGLERVSTDEDDEDGTSDEAVESSEAEAESEEEPETDGTNAADETDETDAAGASDEDDGDDEVPVRATGGRFDDLDLFDYVAIAGAAFEAAREEYRSRA